MSDISEDAGDVELMLAVEVQVNARVLTVLEQLFLMQNGTLSSQARGPGGANWDIMAAIGRVMALNPDVMESMRDIAGMVAKEAIARHFVDDHNGANG